MPQGTYARDIARALVGDFVDDAVPLREALRSGNGIGALFSLFETSLRGFRLQPFADKAQPMTDVLKTFAEGLIRAGEVLSETVERAKQFGLKSEVTDLQRMVCEAAAKVPCIEGPCHGDLHPGNVMVRGGDAILIDFSSACKGPLTADPACLEVSLLFGTDEYDKPDSFSGWQGFIDEIYGTSNTNLHPSSLFVVQPGPFAWLRRSLRELRTFSWDAAPSHERPGSCSPPICCVSPGWAWRRCRTSSRSWR